MTYRLLLCILLSTGLFGCQVLSGAVSKITNNEPEEKTEQEQQDCCLSSQNSDMCDEQSLRYWWQFWVVQDGVPWEQRKKSIDMQGTDKAGQLRKIIMSQPQDTPYQDRLRAQNWAQALMSELSEPMQQLLQVVLVKPSQSLLEHESAITILQRRINKQTEQLSQQALQLEQQEIKIDEQQGQIEAFMNIEASIVDAEENKP